MHNPFPKRNQPSTRNLPKQNNHLHVINPNAINRPIHNPSKRNRRGGACVPARTSAQRRFHTKIHALCAGDERRMRPCRATWAGTQAPPLPNTVIHPRTILPNDINYPNETHKQSPHTTIGGGNASRTPAPSTLNEWNFMILASP